MMKLWILALGAVSLAACGGSKTPKVEYHLAPTAAPGVPYSSAVIVDNEMYLSGVIGLKPEGGLAEGGIGPETVQAFANIESILDDRGARMADLVKCTVFLADMAEYGAMNEVYAAQFPGPKPARTTVGANGLPLGAAVEIECMALMP